MKKLLGAGLAVVLAVAAVAAQERSRVYSDPSPPPREALERLNLVQGWRAYVPMDGRRDGFVSVQLAGKQLLTLTRSGGVTALDAETGQLLWTVHIGLPYKTEQAPGFNSRSVFVMNNTRLHALDRRTGITQWFYSVPFGVSAPPIADEENVYICSVGTRIFAYRLPFLGQVAERKPEAAGTVPPAGAPSPVVPVPPKPGDSPRPPDRTGYVPIPERQAQEEALNPKPRLVWDDTTNVPLELVPLQTRDLVVLPSPRGAVVALTKAILINEVVAEPYRFQAEATIRIPAGQFDETAYVGADNGNLYALNMVTGKVPWRYSAGSPITRRPIATEKDVYVTSEEAGMTRLDRATGEVGWRIPRGREVADTNPDADRFLAANPKFVYATDRSNRLMVLERERGTTLSRYDTRDFVFPVPNEFTDRLYLAANSGLIVCLHDREYTSPFVHKKVEEKPPEPAAPLAVREKQLKQKLLRPITEPQGEPMPLRALLDTIEKKYAMRIILSDKAFKEAMLEPIGEKPAAHPKADAVPLGDVLTQILQPLGAKWDQVTDTVFVTPLAKPK
jgi:hypothetical protein